MQRFVVGLVVLAACGGGSEPRPEQRAPERRDTGRLDRIRTELTCQDALHGIQRCKTAAGVDATIHIKDNQAESVTLQMSRDTAPTAIRTILAGSVDDKVLDSLVARIDGEDSTTDSLSAEGLRASVTRAPGNSSIVHVRWVDPGTGP